MLHGDAWEAPGMTLWLERLRPSDLHVMLPQVLLTLDQIRDQAMEPERRLSMLRALRDQVDAILTWAPSPRATLEDRARRSGDAGSRARSARPPGLVQRVARSWCHNLQRLMIDLGQPRFEGISRFAVYREWTLRQLTRGLRQSVELAVRFGQPQASGMWRCVYDLFLYLDGRDELDGTTIPGRARFNPGMELKRIMLLGGICDLADTPRVLREIAPKLADWAAAAELTHGNCVVGDTRLLRVDVTRDQPPHWNGEGLEAPYRGWLLQPPRAYLDYLQGHRERAPRRAAVS